MVIAFETGPKPKDVLKMAIRLICETFFLVFRQPMKCRFPAAPTARHSARRKRIGEGKFLAENGIPKRLIERGGTQPTIICAGFRWADQALTSSICLRVLFATGQMGIRRYFSHADRGPAGVAGGGQPKLRHDCEPPHCQHQHSQDRPRRCDRRLSRTEK